MISDEGQPRSPPRPKTRVLIALPSDLYRQGMRTALDTLDVNVVGHADTGAGALDLARQFAPDVMVVDAWLPDMSGVELTSCVLAQLPACRVLMFSEPLDDEVLLDALAAGASGHVAVGSSVEELHQGIRLARAGGVPLPQRAAARLAERIRDTPRTSRAREGSAARLSDRELDVLRLLCTGMGNARIAKVLMVSPTTVKKHVSRILAKLKVDNRVQAAVYAVRVGLADPSSGDHRTLITASLAATAAQQSTRAPRAPPAG
jgi:two-component system, NarL family, response regulator LiaR